ncbi:MAG: NAD-dependent deacylase [Chitinophagaceae bacterium]|nr:MAG: NAD-dependent deacylase [Chitinophagaceae bacterium]
MTKKRIIVLSGAGISAESGLSTFRDSGGLWENYRIEDVATPEAWQMNQDLVLDFYNMRRKQLKEVKPNKAHTFIADLEKNYDVTVITQNVDDLHERAGSTNIIHLHGELLKVRSTGNENLIYDWEKDLVTGNLCPEGSQLRPHIVWFGEAVPMIYKAMDLMPSADIVIVIGTSLQVYPAAGLVNYARPGVPVYIVDPTSPPVHGLDNIHFIKKSATEGVEQIKKILNEGK